ncbi:hypothetical protein RFI_37514, partial [Reticulomyxa filosa]
MSKNALKDSCAKLSSQVNEQVTILQQQQHLIRLFENFGNQLEKATISHTWRNCNQIYNDTHAKLEEICATSNLNELKEMCLYILWNILKYRQIHKQALYNYFFSKYYISSPNLEQIF